MTRKERLMPGGEPRYVRCYDNGGETFDRFTVIYSGRYAGKVRGWTQYVGMSLDPMNPQGFGQHGESDKPIDTNRWGFAPAIGRKCHLGRRVHFSTLPAKCKRLVLSDYRELWGLD